MWFPFGINIMAWKGLVLVHNTYMYFQTSMNVIKHLQFVELLQSAPTQTEVTSARAWKDLKWLEEAA